MDIAIDDATALVHDVMRALGHSEDAAATITDHLIDCELRGIGYGGLARAISIVERIGRIGMPQRPIAVEHETPVSARIDGADHIGYVVAQHATELAIAKADTAGIAVVGARDTWYTGMLSYFAEQATARGLVTLIASNASPWVAPYGASEGRFGTNPICFGFPSVDTPVIWDIGTSSIMHAEVTLAGRRGELLDEGRAYGPDGAPTREPAAALAGAFTAWGGHKGSGLGIVVQLLGMFAGSPGLPPDLAGFGFLMVTIRPDLLGDADAFKASVSGYAADVRAARPVPGGPPVRMPFDRSAAARERTRAAGRFTVDDAVIARLQRVLKRADN